MFRFIKNTEVLFAVLVLLLPCAAKAMPVSTVDIVHNGFGANDVVTIWGGSQNGLDVYAGVYMLDKTNGYSDGKLWPNGQVAAFCTELREMAPETTLTYDVIQLEQGPEPTTFLGGGMGTVKANYVRELWARFYNSDWASGGEYTYQQNSKAAAFAAAIWEIVHEDLPTSSLGWDVTVDGTPGDRGFRVEGVDMCLANSWLHALTGNGPKADLRVFSYNGAQDYIVEVPEPATIALLGFGGIFSLLRKRRNTA
jgi:hypothetical protein